MTGAITLLPLYAFMTSTGTTLLSHYVYFELLRVLTHVINTGCKNGYVYFYCGYLSFVFLGAFPESEIYVTTFRNTLSVSSSPINIE
jgi:hypothetical protein